MEKSLKSRLKLVIFHSAPSAEFASYRRSRRRRSYNEISAAKKVLKVQKYGERETQWANCVARAGQTKRQSLKI